MSCWPSDDGCYGLKKSIGLKNNGRKNGCLYDGYAGMDRLHFFVLYSQSITTPMNSSGSSRKPW
jgi:hypothetical protein